MRPSTDILVFSDSKETKNVFSNFLTIDRSIIQFAEKGEEGIKKFCNQDFDLVIVEISQPLISEIEFFEQLRMLNPQMPIVIVSKYFHDTRSIVFQNQISDFITLPLTLDKLSSTISNVQNQKELPNNFDQAAEIDPNNKRLSFLYEISKSLSSINDFDTLINEILTIATDALYAERATLFILDKNTNELWSRIGTGIEKHEIRFSQNSGIAGRVVATGITIHSEDPYNHPDFNKSIDSQTGFITNNLICVPLKNRTNEIIGAFQVLNKIAASFNNDDISFFKSIASTVAIALENQLLREDLKNKYEEVHRLSDELFIAQNQILIDSKLAVLNEVIDFIEKVRNRFSLTAEADKLIPLIRRNNAALKQANRFLELHDKYLDKISGFLNNLKKDLSAKR